MLRNKLLKPTILSTLICIAAYMAVRIADVLILTAFLRFNNISFKYSPFLVEYVAGGKGNWTEGKVLFIYTLPHLTFALLGIYLPHILRRKDSIWFQLTITWLSFHMILMVMSGLATGIFMYKGVGVALEWIFVNTPVKVTGVLIILSMLFVSARRFGWYFLRKVPDGIYHDDYQHRRLWLNRAVLIPFIVSLCFIFPAAGPEMLIESVCTLVLGLIFIAVIYRMIPLVFIPLSK
jgi:hypothetical protein